MTSRLSKPRRPLKIELSKHRVPVNGDREGLVSGKTNRISCGAQRQCQLIGSRCFPPLSRALMREVICFNSSLVRAANVSQRDKTATSFWSKFSQRQGIMLCGTSYCLIIT